jgi:predicted transcriptional regulator
MSTEERGRRLSSLDAAIERGMADIDDGCVHAADDVFKDLKTRYGSIGGKPDGS